MRIKKIKQKSCKQCGELFTPMYSTIQPVCSPKCAVKYNKPTNVKKRVKEIKQNIYGDNVFENLQTWINKIVRLIDRGHPCMSSGIEYGKYYPNAGHFYSVGSNPSLRFNLLNIFNQSANDNNQGGGKGSNYGNGLIQTFGQEIFEEINSLPSKYKRIDLTRQEAKQALNICRGIAKELQMADVIFSTDYRIEVRKKLNERIGIYK